MRYDLDTDFLVYALSRAGSERRRLRALGDSDDEIRRSAVAWYEFSRGPRTPEQLAVVRSLFGEDGVSSPATPATSRASRSSSEEEGGSR
jgi:hypothetical protein